MKRLSLIWIVLAGLVGCSSNHYGYTAQQWNDFTPEQRQEVTQQLEAMLEDDSEQQREKEFQNRSLNVNFGTRSNQY